MAEDTKSGQPLVAVDDMTIHQLIPKVMTSVRAVAKDHRNNQFNYNFRSIDDVLNALSPALRENGVSLGIRILSTTDQRVESSKGTGMNRVVVHIAIDLTGPAGDVRTLEGVGEAADAQDKAHMKAMVQAFKYAMLLGLSIPTDEADPDGESPDTGGRDMTPKVGYVGWAKDEVIKLCGSDTAKAAEVWAQAVDVAEVDVGTREAPKPIGPDEAQRIVEAAKLLAVAAPAPGGDS